MFYIFYQACTFYAPENILAQIAYVGFRVEMPQKSKPHRQRERDRHPDPDM